MGFPTPVAVFGISSFANAKQEGDTGIKSTLSILSKDSLSVSSKHGLIEIGRYDPKTACLCH